MKFFPFPQQFFILMVSYSGPKVLHIKFLQCNIKTSSLITLFAEMSKTLSQKKLQMTPPSEL